MGVQRCHVNEHDRAVDTSAIQRERRAANLIAYLQLTNADISVMLYAWNRGLRSSGSQRRPEGVHQRGIGRMALDGYWSKWQRLLGAKAIFYPSNQIQNVTDVGVYWALKAQCLYGGC